MAANNRRGGWQTLRPALFSVMFPLQRALLSPHNELGLGGGISFKTSKQIFIGKAILSYKTRTINGEIRSVLTSLLVAASMASQNHL